MIAYASNACCFFSTTLFKTMWCEWLLLPTHYSHSHMYCWSCTTIYEVHFCFGSARPLLKKILFGHKSVSYGWCSRAYMKPHETTIKPFMKPLIDAVASVHGYCQNTTTKPQRNHDETATKPLDFYRQNDETTGFYKIIISICYTLFL